jgi:sugar phosphate isomerase/epimerase
MKYAICSEVFDTPIEETLRVAGEIGFDGVEIAPFNVTENVEEVSAARRNEIRAAAERAGVQISGLHWLLLTPKGLHVTTLDDDLRQRSWQYVEALVNFCADLGGEFLILGSPGQRSLVEGDSLAAAMDRVVPHLRDVGDVAARRDVHFLLETLDPPQTSFLNKFEDTMELLGMVDHPHINFMLDTRAMEIMTEDAPGVIRKYGGKASYFHANQPDGRGPGMGDYDFRPVFEALDEVGYSGWVSTEPFDYTPDGVTIGRTALETLRKARI